jgi:hypothetical protein
VLPLAVNNVNIEAPLRGTADCGATQAVLWIKRRMLYMLQDAATSRHCRKETTWEKAQHALRIASVRSAERSLAYHGYGNYPLTEEAGTANSMRRWAAASKHG